LKVREHRSSAGGESQKTQRGENKGDRETNDYSEEGKKGRKRGEKREKGDVAYFGSTFKKKAVWKDKVASARSISK